MRITFQGGVLAVSTVMLASVAWGQAQTSAQPDALLEIVVTAQRRSENLQDVPIAVTALSGSDLKSSGVDSTMDLPTLSPGLTVPESSGFVTPHIRGVGTSTFGAGLENSVALYVDGVYLASAPSSIARLNDISSVEVLKGPQGTLFGRNATGGLIQITTKEPTSEFSGDASIGYGNYNTKSGSLYVTGGPTDKIAGNLSLITSLQSDGYGTNLFTGESVNKDTRNYAARSKWLLQAADDTSLHISFDYSADAGNEFTTETNAPGFKPLFGPALVTANPWNENSDYSPYNDYKGGGASIRLVHDFGASELNDTVAYRHSRIDIGFDADATTLPIETIVPLIDRETQYSEELQLLSHNGSPITWVGGLYYFYGKGAYTPSQVNLGGPATIPLGPPPAPSLNEIQIVGDQTTSSGAAYGQATAKVADQTNLTLGLRYTYERRELHANEYGFFGDAIGLGTLIPTVDESKSFSAPTWRLSLDHHFTDDTMSYISYNRGFKSGGFNVGVPTDPAFQPEKLDAYEIGLKTETLDHRIRINSAAYYYNYSDIQVSHFTLGQIGYYNGAKAHLYGLDLDIEMDIVHNLRLTGGIALNHSDFSSFPNAVLAAPQPEGGSILSTGSATGNELPFAPSAAANLSANYRIPVGSGNIDANLTDYYSSFYFTSADNVPRQPAYDLLNGSMRWSSSDERYSVAIWGRNLLNKAIADGINESAISTLIHYQPPRTYGFILASKF